MRRAPGAIIGRALTTGLLAALVLPIGAALLALAVAHLAGGCGPGSSGGCEMGAAGVWLYALLPSFVLGIGYSLFRTLR